MAITVFSFFLFFEKKGIVKYNQYDNKKQKSGKPLSQAVLEFGQFLGLLATMGGNELDESEGENHDEESNEDHRR